MAIKSLLRLCVKRVLEPLVIQQVAKSSSLCFFFLLHIRKVGFSISSGFIFSVLFPGLLGCLCSVLIIIKIACGLFIMYTIVCSLTTWCCILSWTLTVKAHLDSVTSLYHLPKSLLHGLRCCLYLWLPASLGLSCQGSVHFHWRPQPIGAEDCFLTRWEPFYALAAAEPVLSVAVVAVYSWDWSRFRVLAKCPVVGTALLKEESLRCFTCSTCYHICHVPRVTSYFQKLHATVSP